MITHEDSRAWLAHKLADLDDDELAHYGVLGMHWGHRKDEPPVSGIKSHATDKMAKQDAKEYAKAYKDKSNGASYYRSLVNKRIKSRSARIPEYSKALEYHKPRAEKALKREGHVAATAINLAGVGFLAYANREFLTRLAGSAALKVAARRGAKASAPILKAIGNKPIATMAKGLDGVWRLAA